MEIQTVCLLQDFLALESDWQRLWRLQKSPKIFQHHAWVFAFIEAFCQARKWMVLVAREGGAVSAILPIWEDARTGCWRLAGSPNSDYNYLLGDPAAIVRMLPHAASLGVRSVLFEAMPEGPAFWQSLKTAGLCVVETGAPAPCWHITLNKASIRALREKKGMKDNERRLSRVGALRLRVITHGMDQQGMLETLFEQHRKRWNPGAKSSQFNYSASCDFYRRVCASPDLTPFVCFSVLEAGEQVLACHIGFVQGDSFIYYKPAYDPAFKGAGKLQLCMLMEEALRLGLKEFDFTRGNEPYKVELATGVRYNHEARLFFSTAAGLIFRSRQWLRRSVPRDTEGLALT
ncbi:MAG: hypothetical protein JWO94_2265, partial [Verrucomicrobiaceae bacterium]|nr:hypothetical protein [Verrucomicrobiaceae bacterium]